MRMGPPGITRMTTTGSCSGSLRRVSSERRRRARGARRVIECQHMSALERRVAVEAARAAGHLLRAELVGPRRIQYKGSPTNLVTEMDRRAEALILDRLGDAFPDDAVLGEETGSRPGGSGRRWIVDPLDGT